MLKQGAFEHCSTEDQAARSRRGTTSPSQARRQSELPALDLHSSEGMRPLSASRKEGFKLKDSTGRRTNEHQLAMYDSKLQQEGP